MFEKLMKLVRAPIAVLTSVGVLCGALSSPVQAINLKNISQVYFFGDSLSDSGFNDLWPTVANPPTVPLLPAGKAPTFTTFGGYTWSQYVARDIKGFVLPVYPGPAPADTITNNGIYAVPGFVSGTLINGVNYAAGGSTTNSTGVVQTWAPSLHQQIQWFLLNSPRVLDPNAVYFIWSGANDILALLLAAPPVPTQLQLLQAASLASINVANEVAALSARGAKRIVVVSLPNFGIAPLITATAAALDLPELPAQMKNLSFTFNSMLNQQLGRVIAQYHTKVLYVDVYALLNNVVLATQAGKPYVVAGQSFQFVNYTSPACGSTPSAIYCPSGTPEGYVFADGLHPTDMAHRLLSLQIETDLQNWA